MFTWDAARVGETLGRARLAQGTVLGMAQAIGLEDHPEVLRDIWVGEALATAGIEGEKLDLAAVRSSVLRKIGHADGKKSPRNVDGLVDVMDDASRNYSLPLTHERLRSWQAALFPDARSGLNRIAVGEYRTHADPMQIVSGRPGKEKVHYVAPPSNQVRKEMSAFIKWFNSSVAPGTSAVDGLIRAALAHLWFESIHPFEDGNGRVGRAICDLALAQDRGSPVRIYSLARQLNTQRAQYYQQLNAAQCGDLDVTDWTAWFIEQFEAACISSAQVIESALRKARFWDTVPELNQRQRKAVQRLLDAEPAGFQGGLRTEKYINLTGASKATATRDLTDLAERGVLSKTGQGKGTRYWLTSSSQARDNSTRVQTSICRESL